MRRSPSSLYTLSEPIDNCTLVSLTFQANKAYLACVSMTADLTGTLHMEGIVMAKGNVRKYNKDKGFESLSRNMLQDEEHLSLEAIGLLANLTSYADDWVVHKTELYKRFAKSGRRKVESAWNELVEQKYIVQLRKRKGRRYEYIYYHSQERFTEEQIAVIEKEEDCSVWNGKVTNEKTADQKPKLKEPQPDKVSWTVRFVQSKITSGIWTVRFVQSKLNSTKRTYKRLTIKEINYQDKKIDTFIDTEDTREEMLSTSLGIPLLQKQKRRETYIQEAFLANTDRIPKELAEMLAVFTDSPEQAASYYSVMLTARKQVEKELDIVLWLEHEEVVLNQLIHGAVRAFRHIHSNGSVSNPAGYMYTTVYQTLMDALKGLRMNDELPSFVS